MIYTVLTCCGVAAIGAAITVAVQALNLRIRKLNEEARELLRGRSFDGHSDTPDPVLPALACRNGRWRGASIWAETGGKPWDTFPVLKRRNQGPYR